MVEFEVVIDDRAPGRPSTPRRATFRALLNGADGSLALQSTVAGGGTTAPRKIEIVLDATSADALKKFLVSPPEK